MTRKTNTRKFADDHLVTEEEMAALDFEPMHFDREPNWNRFAPSMVKIHQIAWTLLQKTKPELMAIADTLDDAASMAVLHDFTETIERSCQLNEKYCPLLVKRKIVA